MSESDGVEETVEGGIRATMMSAAKVGEVLARVRQQHAQRAAAESEAQARALAGRLEAEKTAARIAYRGVDDPQWWAATAPEQVASTYRTAAAWKDVDPEAARVEGVMAGQIRERYDVDVRAAAAGALGPQLTAAADEAARRGSLDLAESAVLLTAAERADQQANEADAARDEAATPEEAAEAENRAESSRQEATALEEQSEIAWDSAERREATARDLSAKVKDPEAVAAKMKADLSQAKPATEATQAAGRRAPKARAGRGQTGGRQRIRQRGMSR